MRRLLTKLASSCEGNGIGSTFRKLAILIGWPAQESKVLSKADSGLCGRCRCFYWLVAFGA